MTQRLCLALVAALICLLAPAAASAADPMEKVWKYGSGDGAGQVAVRAGEGGTFTGTVIRRIFFSTCPHEVGEIMWTEIRKQPDGSYWGKHQWFNTSDCSPIGRGNTAFRILSRPDGKVFLRVCFANPNNPSKQPTIAADGTSANTDTSCDDSDLVGELPPGTPKVDAIAVLPKQGKKKCMSRRAFKIRLKEPPGDALVTALVFVNGRRVATRSGKRVTATVSLKGLPKGRYTVRIVATTVLGKTIKGTRRYKTCTKRQRNRSRSPI